MAEIIELMKNNKDENKENVLDVDVDIKYMIGIEDMLEFVEEVSANAFDSEGEYIPAVVDFLIKANTIKRYTNAELPEDIHEQYSFIYTTDLFEQICEHINQVQLKEIIGAIDNKIAYMRQTNIDNIKTKLNDLIGMFEDLEEEMLNIFGGISPEEMKGFMEMFSKGAIPTEKDIVKAYVEERYSEENKDEH